MIMIFVVKSQNSNDTQLISPTIAEYTIPLDRNGLSVTSFWIKPRINISRFENSAKIILEIKREMGTAINESPSFTYRYNYNGQQYGNETLGKGAFTNITTSDITYEVMVSYGSKSWGWMKVDGMTNMFGPVDKDAKASDVMVYVRVVGLNFNGTSEIENKIRAILKNQQAAIDNDLLNRKKEAEIVAERNRINTNTNNVAAPNSRLSSTNNSSASKDYSGSGQLSSKVKVNGSEVQVYEQGGKYYVKNGDGSQNETTKSAYDQINTVATKNDNARNNAEKQEAERIANYNASVALQKLTFDQKQAEQDAKYAKVEAYTQLAVGVIGLLTPSPEEQARKERERQAAAEREEAYRQSQMKLQKENEEKAKYVITELLKKNPPVNFANKNFLVIDMMDNYIPEKYNTDVTSLIPEWKIWMSESIAQNDHYSSVIFAGKALGFYTKKFDHNIGISSSEALATLEKISNSEPETQLKIGVSFDMVKKTISEKKKNKKSTSIDVMTFPIKYVAPNSSAEIADIRINDVIIKINNKYENDFVETIQKHKEGDLVKLTIVRNGKEIINEVKLEKKLKNSFKVDAILTLAHYYNLKNKGNDPEKALYYFTKAAENESPIAMFALGEIYKNLVYGNKKENVKFKFKKNEEFALDWYLKSINNPKYQSSELQKSYKMGTRFEPQSFDELITMFKKGIGCKKNPEKAEEILKLKNTYLAEYVSDDGLNQVGENVSP